MPSERLTLRLAFVTPSIDFTEGLRYLINFIDTPILLSISMYLITANEKTPDSRGQSAYGRSGRVELEPDQTTTGSHVADN